MEKRNEEGGNGWSEKNVSGRSSHLILQTKCLIPLPASPSCSSLPSLGQTGCQIWSQLFFILFFSPLFFSLKCIGHLRAERPVRAERGSESETYGAHQHDINQTAKETPEKVQSKQTDPSHDSRENAGPHRSRPGCTDQPTPQPTQWRRGVGGLEEGLPQVCRATAQLRYEC